MIRLVLIITAIVYGILLNSFSTIAQVRNNGVKIKIIPDTSFVKENYRVLYKNNLWSSMNRTLAKIPFKEAVKNKAENNFFIPLSNSEKGVYITIEGLRKDQFGNEITDFFAENGDSIVCTVLNDSYFFNGIGSDKFRCQYDLLKSNLSIPKDMARGPNYKVVDNKIVIDYDFSKWVIQNFKTEIKIIETTKQIENQILEWYRSDISEFSYELLKANIFGNNEAMLMRKYLKSIDYLGNYIDSAKRYEFIQDVEKSYQNRPKSNFSCFRDSTLAYSSGFLDFKTTIKDEMNIQNIISNYNGLLRDRLLSVFFLRNFLKAKYNNKWLLESIPIMTDSVSKNLLLTLSKALSSGKGAYEFSLPNLNNELINLKDFRGKVVVIDFWFTGCGNCIDLNSGMKQVIQHFRKNPNIVFIGISIDRDYHKWKKSVVSELYSNKGVVDLYTNGLGSNHPIIQHYNIIGYPFLMVIDKNGKIITTSPTRPNIKFPDKIRGFISELEIYTKKITLESENKL